MNPELLAVAAGLPHEIGDRFIQKSSKVLSRISWIPLDKQKEYDESYCAKLYTRLSDKLKELDLFNRSDALKSTNLIVLYVDKSDGSEEQIFRWFGVEAVILPLRMPDFANRLLDTKNQQGQVINELYRELTRAVRRARELLSEIADEITNRDNKTCLLLPCKNFGEDIYKILDCVHGVSREREATFQNRLNSILPSLRTSRVQKRTYYVGKNGLVFRSPGKAGARHGLAPSWSVPDHKLSCVIRGRMRFGVSYDPKFHYDCDISKISKRRFPSCHDFKKIRKSKRHINIAPNDNVR